MTSMQNRGYVKWGKRQLQEVRNAVFSPSLKAISYPSWSPLLTLRNEHRTYLATFLAKWTTLAISGIFERRERLKSLSVDHSSN